MPPIRAQHSARSARMMNDEERLALVETICAQRSELFIRTSSFVNRTSLQLPIVSAEQHPLIAGAITDTSDEVLNPTSHNGKLPEAYPHSKSGYQSQQSYEY